MTKRRAQVDIRDLPHVRDCSMPMSKDLWRAWWPVALADVNALVDEATMLDGLGKRVFIERAERLFDSVIASGSLEADRATWMRSCRRASAALRSLADDQEDEATMSPTKRGNLAAGTPRGESTSATAPPPAPPPAVCPTCGSSLDVTPAVPASNTPQGTDEKQQQEQAPNHPGSTLPLKPTNE